MYSTSSDFKKKIIDGQTRQNALLVFNSGYLSANDGDFTEDGITFNEYMCTGEELSFGECPSSTISFSVVNDNDDLSDFGWGSCQAYIGVLLSSEESTDMDDNNCYIEVDDYTYWSNSDGFYCDGTMICTIPFSSLVSIDGVNYAYSEGKLYEFSGMQLIESDLDTARMLNKFAASNHSIVFTDNTATVWKYGLKETWEYCPMGIYKVSRPSKTHVREVSVSDAYDNMSKLDSDCSAFLAELTYPVTCEEMVKKICLKVQVSYEPFSLINGSTEISSTTFTASNVSTYRDILSYIMVLNESCAWFGRNGSLHIGFLSNKTYYLTPEMISLEEYSFGEYVCAAPKKLMVGCGTGIIYTLGTGDNAYSIYGNPLITEPSEHMLATVSAFPSYVPSEVRVIESDPSVECGDYVSAYTSREDEGDMVDGSGNNIVDNDGDDILLSPGEHICFPVMSQTITWNNLTSTTYIATGYATRQIPSEADDYTVTVASEKTDGLATGTTTINGNCIRTGTLNADLVDVINIKADNIQTHTGTYAATDWTVKQAAMIVAVMNGTVPKATAIANGYDLNGDGDIDGFDLILCRLKMLHLNSWDENGGDYTATMNCKSAFNAIQVRAGDDTAFAAGVHGVFGRTIFSGSSLIIFDEDTGHQRAILDPDGLKFYDANGSLIKTYSAT